jgi:outer membrane immunogenic protein
MIAPNDQGVRGTMRFAIAGLAVLALVHSASAADYRDPILRGSQWDADVPNYRDWSGFYVGGHIGYSSATADFEGNGSSVIADILRLSDIEAEFNVSQWVSPGGHGNGTPFGIFFGYNWQSEDVVYGFDVAYSHGSIMGGGTDSLTRRVTTSANRTFDVTASATMAAEITDLLSLRGRGGVSMGAFLPYATLGVAVARLNVVNRAFVTTQELDISVNPIVNIGAPVTVPGDASKNGAFAFGLSAGLGFDWEIFPQMFLRAEYEYLAFAPVEDIKISIHTARAGVGVRF